MAASPEAIAYERGVRPILRFVLPDNARAVLKFQPDPQLQARIEELASKSTEGELTRAERREYEEYGLANKFVAILQRQARHLVKPAA